MLGQRPVIDGAIAVRSASRSAPPDHLTSVVTPAYPHDRLLDGEKTGAALLCSGLCLALVGVTLTAMGWQRYQGNPNFQWPQLLGPILISVGGTFVLTSVCRFGITSCRPCRHWDEEVLVVPVMEQTSAGHSITLGGINQPIVLQGATTMLRIPPPYNFIAHEGSQAPELQPCRSVNGLLAALPPLDAPHPADNAAFTAEGCAHGTELDRSRGR